jgi:two-component system KDP operon response regulator KdpE
VAPSSDSPFPATSPLSVLVIEDEPGMLRVVTNALTARGYWVTPATTGRAALDAATTREPDIVVLDLGLPDIDGIDVCRHLRRWLRTPIIVLTADGSDDRKVAALDEGADDYVTKPFSMPEFLARVRVAARHRRVLSTVVDDDCLEVGSLRIDVAAHEATLDGVRLDLAPKEFALVTLLARNAGKVLTHRMLLAELWADRQDGGTQPLRTTVTTLRKKLEVGPKHPVLVTEPGVGYRLLRPEEDQANALETPATSPPPILHTQI